MRVLQAIVAFFTFVLLFIQQKYAVCAGSCSTEKSQPAWPRHLCSDSPCAPAALPLLPADCAGYAHAARGHEERGRPKYKRDPEIAVDNEFIGYRPHDDD